MLLLKNLGKRNTTLIHTGTGRYQQKSYGLFQCPLCKEAFERPMTRGHKQKTCAKCRSKRQITHGMSGTKEYHVWRAMKSRCDNAANSKYHIYGKAGITYDPKWSTFEGYWDDMGESYKAAKEAADIIPGRRHDVVSIDRIDSNKGYTKENCRWITQSLNSSLTKKRRPVIQNRVVLKPVRHYIEVARFESAKMAADELGLVAAHITATCKGNRKTHGGFNWAYTK